MSEENKGELIKNESKKKVVVIKKAKPKKVIIKKLAHSKDETVEDNKPEILINESITQDINTEKDTNTQNQEQQHKIQTTTGPSDISTGDKPRQPKIIKTSSYQQQQQQRTQFGNNPNYTQRPRTGFNNPAGGSSVGGGYQGNRFNKDQKPGEGYQPRGIRPGGMAGGQNKQAPSTPIVQQDKERSRKKIVHKKTNDYGIKKETGEREIKKAFKFKKKDTAKETTVPSQIDIMDVVSISDLSKKMNLKVGTIISKLMQLGMMVTINDTIEASTAEIVASEFNCKVNIVSLYDQTVIEDETVDDSEVVHKTPVVTVMGHVDHGKTKLLDAIRSTNVISGESGGITQHIGAYSVLLENGKHITFIDTPGHEAFTMMRARGAQITDIVVLVVAADDGIKPQTIEAINHAKEAGVPIVVAINKIDKETANPEKVKQQLTEYGLLPEEWGGQTLYCEVSALNKLGIEELLDTILLQAEMMELTTSEKVKPTGFVLEAKIDPGRGVVITIITKNGILKVGDFFVAGIYYGKIRAIYNDHGDKIKSVKPSIPVEITGIENVPKAGDPFNVTANEKEAKIYSSKRQELNRMEDAKSVKKVTLNDLLAQKKDGEVQELKVIIKADVQGSSEAIKHSLEKLSNKEIHIKTVSSSVGAINESDVMLAVASEAIIIGFHVRPNPKASELADKEKVVIKRYNIIYDVIEDIKASMEGMIKPDLLEEMIGTCDVKQTFKISKVGTIAGCIVSSGKVRRKSLVRVIRDDVEVYSGKIASLKRFKDEVSEVNEGTECGIALEGYKDIKDNDILEIYEIKEITRTLKDIDALPTLEPEVKESGTVI